MERRLDLAQQIEAMTDVLTSEQRHRNMSHIRSQDTAPEMIVRRGLHAMGFRFRLRDPALPGRPDVVLKRHHAVVFVHGCFWHGHGCPMFRLPGTHREYWAAKIEFNQRRDTRVVEALLNDGWRIVIVWECSLRGRGRLTDGTAIELCADFLRSGRAGIFEIKGNPS